MAEYDYKCSNCGKIVTINVPIGQQPNSFPCHCKCGVMDRVYYAPNISFNHWNPDLKFVHDSGEMNGEREAIADGMYD